LAHPMPARAAWLLQDSSNSSAQPAASAENPQKAATDQAQPNTADQKHDESKPDGTPPKEAETPGAKKSPTSPPASARKHRSRTHKPLTANGEPRKIVVHRGGTGEPIAQILPGITEEEANHQRETAEQLLSSTESNLKQLAARTLNPNQQEEIVQIRYYTEGARSALHESDTQRAHTLALKAYLLSEDMAKR